MIDLSVKTEILKTLEENRGLSLSGEALAESLGISRAAVWKAIQSLRGEGYAIDALPKKGYTLCLENDRLSEEGIQLYRENKGTIGKPLFVFQTIDSTNQHAKRLAVEGARHGTAVLADEQTAGRGRLGRSFYSPKGTGLYISFILRPTAVASLAPAVTTAASVAVSRALAKTYGIETQIKWVNDIYYQGKKICGILAEAVSDFQTGAIEALILGIGINIDLPEGGFPDDLASMAGTLFPNPPSYETVKTPEKPTRNQLAAAIMDQIEEVYEKNEFSSLLPEYRKRCFILGKEINVFRGNETFPARAIDVEESGGLVVETADGKIEVLRSGEITIRLN